MSWQKKQVIAAGQYMANKKSAKLAKRVQKFKELAAEFDPEPPQDFHELAKALQIPTKKVIKNIVRQMFRNLDVKDFPYLSSYVRMSFTTICLQEIKRSI
jgi:hypothetical protein